MSHLLNLGLRNQKDEDEVEVVGPSNSGSGDSLQSIKGDDGTTGAVVGPSPDDSVVEETAPVVQPTIEDIALDKKSTVQHIEPSTGENSAVQENFAWADEEWLPLDTGPHPYTKKPFLAPRQAGEKPDFDKLGRWRGVKGK
ncbi:MAG: hypothetical protein Q9224_007378 [Gallowayella concinna]